MERLIMTFAGQLIGNLLVRIAIVLLVYLAVAYHYGWFPFKKRK